MHISNRWLAEKSSWKKASFEMKHKEVDHRQAYPGLQFTLLGRDQHQGYPEQ